MDEKARFHRFATRLKRLGGKVLTKSRKLTKTLSAFLPKYSKYTGSTGRFDVRRLLLFALAVSAIFQLYAASSRLVYGPSSFPPALRSSTEEMLLALNWLKKKSPPDSIVLTHQVYGHRIVAFANRRTVSTTKVYPSESTEVATRYRAIAKFFFSPTEETALKIADAYKVNYIFVPKNLPLSNCAEAGACHFVAGSSLTPDGTKKTLVGMMLSGVPLQHFTPVWSSANFRIFRINHATPIAPCAPSQDEKAQLLAYAREVMSQTFIQGDMQGIKETGIFGEICAVDVAIYVNGRLRGSVISAGKLGEAIKFVAAESLRDSRFQPVSSEELQRATIQVTIWDTDAMYPISKRLAYQQPLDSTKGYMVRAGDKKGIFLPAVFNSGAYRKQHTFFSRLCAKAGLPGNCMYLEDSRLYAFSVIDFAENEARNASDFYGPLILDQSLARWQAGVGESQLRDAVTSALDWIISMQRGDGSFRAAMDPFQPDVLIDQEREPVLTAYHAWVLAEAYDYFRDARYLNAAKSGLNRSEERLKGIGPAGTGEVIGIILTKLKLANATGEQPFLVDLGKYIDFAKSLQGSGWISSGVEVGDNGITSGRSSRVQRIVTYSLFYAIARYRLQTGDESVDPLLKEWAKMISEDFAYRRLTDNSLSLAEASWIVDGLRMYASLDSTGNMTNVAKIVTRWLLDNQFFDQAQGIRGAFYNTPASHDAYTRGTSKVAESLTHALLLAEEDDERFNLYRDALRRTFLWIIQMQYRGQSLVFIPIEGREKVRGAVRESLASTIAPLDSAGHFALAGVWYLRDFAER